MKNIGAVIGLLVLGACAQLTGDPKVDCLNATNMLNAAQAAAALAEVNAAVNPGSARMQELAALAQAALSLAAGQQAVVCK